MSGTLVFDGKCPICAKLAHKILLHSTRPVRLLSLSDPEATELLDTHYPHGWNHDFYYVDGERSWRGFSSLRQVAQHVGIKNLVLLSAEYAAYRVQRGKCVSADHSHHTHHDARQQGIDRGRRRFIAGAVAVPLLYGSRRCPNWMPLHCPPSPSPSSLPTLLKSRKTGKGDSVEMFATRPNICAKGPPTATIVEENHRARRRRWRTPNSSHPRLPILRRSHSAAR